MTKRNRKYKKLFEALHGRNERLLARAIVRGLRSDLANLPNMYKENYEGILAAVTMNNLEQELLSHYIRCGQIGSILYNELDVMKTKRLNPFFSEVWNNWVMNTASLLIGSRIRSIKGTLLEELTGVVIQAMEVNADLTDIRNLIYEYVKQPTFYKWQAQRIARTETTYAMNNAMNVAADESQLKLNKTWIAAGDGRERSTHRELNGTTIPENDTFFTGLAYPGDPRGSAEEVINCRCTIGYEPIRDANGNLILN